MRHFSLAAVFIVIALVIPAAPAAAQLYEDPDPYSSTGKNKCAPATNYDSCIAKCDCQYSNNMQRCGTSPLCRDLAASERNACYGNCMTDYTT